jgi:hypothetical protein
LKIYNAAGMMGNLDDNPGQSPLDHNLVEYSIMDLLPANSFDLIITHSPLGEYTRHVRHEEIGSAVLNLWRAHRISTNELWFFAYEDGNKAYYPKPIENATVYRKLTKHIWLRKSKIITEIYGFEKNSWEANSITKTEAFWQFTNSYNASKYFSGNEIK